MMMMMTKKDDDMTSTRRLCYGSNFPQERVRSRTGVEREMGAHFDPLLSIHIHCEPPAIENGASLLSQSCCSSRFSPDFLSISIPFPQSGQVFLVYVMCTNLKEERESNLSFRESRGEHVRPKSTSFSFGEEKSGRKMAPFLFFSPLDFIEMTHFFSLIFSR